MGISKHTILTFIFVLERILFFQGKHCYNELILKKITSITFFMSKTIDLIHSIMKGKKGKGL